MGTKSRYCYVSRVSSRERSTKMTRKKQIWKFLFTIPFVFLSRRYVLAETQELAWSYNHGRWGPEAEENQLQDDEPILDTVLRQNKSKTKQTNENLRRDEEMEENRHSRHGQPPLSQTGVHVD